MRDELRDLQRKRHSDDYDKMKDLNLILVNKIFENTEEPTKVIEEFNKPGDAFFKGTDEMVEDENLVHLSEEEDIPLKRV